MKFLKLLMISGGFLLACNLTTQTATLPALSPAAVTATPLTIPSNITPSVAPVATAVPSPYRDATALLDNVCDAALRPLDGQTFVLRNQAELNTWFETHTTACETLLTAPVFDFSRQTLIGAVKIAEGCDAQFRPLSDNGLIQLQFEVTGNCRYELLAIYLAAIPFTVESVVLVES